MKPTQLIKAVMDGKCVSGFIATGTDRMPAAFLVNMQFRIVMRALPRLRIYRPQSKSKP